jgi:hypothetical protein
MVNWGSICINLKPIPKWKDAEIYSWYWSLTRVKLHKIKSLKSIKDAIKKNQKLKD